MALLTIEELKSLPEAKQKELFSELKSVRKKAKVVSYSAMYGVGATKLAREIKSSPKEAKKLLEAFWKLNWAINAVAEGAEVKLAGPYTWIKNPLSGFWHQLRFTKDSWSTLNQSTGVYCFDTWLFFARKLGVEVVFQFHDEEGNYVKIGQEEENTAKLEKAIQMANDKLKLNVPLGIDIKYGDNYAETH